MSSAVPPQPQAYALGRRSGADAYPYFCLPSYTDGRGTMTLLDPGPTPASCTFKGPTKSQSCDCGYYTYKDAHIVYFPTYGTSDVQSDRIDYGCAPYSYTTSTNVDQYGRVYSYSVPYCPTAGVGF